jgi:hypothetical protein
MGMNEVTFMCVPKRFDISEVKIALVESVWLKLTIGLHIARRLRMSGAIPPRTYVPSWPAQGNFTFTFFSKEACTFTVAV